MGVQLNIKDEATVELARDLARKLNKSVTAVIREALETKASERDAEIGRREAELDGILAEFRRNNAAKLAGVTSKELMDSIYVDGLPE